MSRAWLWGGLVALVAVTVALLLWADRPAPSDDELPAPAVSGRVVHADGGFHPHPDRAGLRQRARSE